MLLLFRERLRDLREELKLEQKDMGNKLNISSSAYGFYEQGRNEPSLETLIKIAEIYNVSTDYLLGLSNRKHQTAYYSVSDKTTIDDKELKVILLMSEFSLLKELSENPIENVTRLKRYWEFIKSEHKLNQ